MDKKKIILFDIDYTLFNTDKFRDITYPQLMELLQQEDTEKYHQKVMEVEKELISRGGYEPVGFAHALSEALKILPKHHQLEQLFYDTTLYETCLYPEDRNVLEKLSQRKDVVLGIVSRGENSFQRRKIQTIKSFFPDNNVFISLTKVDLIERMINQFRDMQIFVIDDSAPFLYEFKKADKKIVVILVEKENRYERRPVADGFIPDFKIGNLTEIEAILDNK